MVDDLRGLRVKRVLLYGDPAHGLVKYADSEQAALIVVPTHGRGPFRRFLWTGAHMEAIPDTGSFSFGRILCALDPMNRDYRALTWAWQFGRDVGAEVKIVHGLTPPHAIELGAEFKDLMLKQAEVEIMKVQQSVGSQAAVEIVAQEVSRAVCGAARDWNADLVVISRGAASGFLGTLRSRSYAIIRESPCPVVSV